MLLPALAGAGVVDHYNVDLTVLPTEEKIRVEAAVGLIAPPGGLGEVEFLLNEGLAIGAALRENDVTTTEELLAVLERTASKEARDRFEGYLKGP